MTALEHAKEAVRLDPQNTQYQMLLQRLQNGGSWYQQRQSSYGYPGTFDSSCCVKLCIANLLCNLCCEAAACAAADMEEVTADTAAEPTFRTLGKTGFGIIKLPVRLEIFEIENAAAPEVFLMVKEWFLEICDSGRLRSPALRGRCASRYSWSEGSTPVPYQGNFLSSLF